MPGPTRMQGKVGSGGSRKEGALVEGHCVRPLCFPTSHILTNVVCGERGELNIRGKWLSNAHDTF